MDPATAETEYNPRPSVPDFAAITSGWAERGAATRARLPRTTHRYGPHPREHLDLFRPEGPSAGTVVFVHGGYWRAFSGAEHSWVAEPFRRRGLTVAVPTYPLAPDVPLGRIAEAIRAAFVHLWREILTAEERRVVVVAGHSAGGYLAAAHLATDWAAAGLPADPIAAVAPISGIFALAPLLDTTMNEAIRLDAAEAARLSLGDLPRSKADLNLFVGERESAAFHAQSADLARRWASLSPTVTSVPHRHHFDVIDDLETEASALHRAIAAPFGL